MTGDERGHGYQFLATAAWFVGMGWTIAVAIVVGVLIGNWVDGETGTHPLFLLVGLLLGLVVGLYGAGVMLMRYLADN